ncbi:MAG: DUF5071 domain-containing protein [Flavobacteriaceae bacterium]|nr:DUF5071 domain-containing protein [Flavobacteriaceae bacterium]
MKNIKILLPKDKLDDSNLEEIKLLNDSDLSQLVSELLTWTQDANWPIFPKIVEIIVARQDLFISEISKVFQTDDWIWKYWILTNICPKLSLENKDFLKKDFDNMAKVLLTNMEEEEILELINTLRK